MAVKTHSKRVEDVKRGDLLQVQFHGPGAHVSVCGFVHVDAVTTDDPPEAITFWYGEEDYISVPRSTFVVLKTQA